MDSFRSRMDEWIWRNYHIEVEHLCARNKDSSKKTYEQMFYHVPVRRSKNVQVERERERRRRIETESILGFPDLWNPWCQAGLKRNARESHQRMASIERISYMVPEAQNKSGDPKDSRLKSPAGARNSRSTMSELPFLIARHDGQK